MVVIASVASVAHAIPSEHRDTHHRPVADRGRATPLRSPDLTDVPATPGRPAEIPDVPRLFATGAPSLLVQRGHDFADLYEGVWVESFAGTDAGTPGAGLFARRHVDGPAPFGPTRASARRDLFVSDGGPRLGMYMLRRPVGMILPGRMTPGQWYEPGVRDRVLGRRAGR